jgi:glutamate-1-semialdehyde 2,1-aminomutase
MLNALKSDPAIYQRLEDKTRYLATGLKEIFTASAIPVQVNQLGSMMSVHFSEEPVTDFASAKKADVQRFSRYFHHSLNDGIYLPPSAFESWFISDALSDADIEHTLQSASRFAMEKKA